MKHELRYFSPETDPLLFACPCGECDVKPLPELLYMLDQVREDAGVAMTVTSGPTCPAYREAKGYSTTSEHIICTGADIVCPNSAYRWSVITAAIAAGVNRIGIGDGFVHLGVSKDHAQCVIWTYY